MPCVARIDYDVVARDYVAGRGLDADGLAGWQRAAAAPYLTNLALPIVDVGSGAGQFSPLLAEWSGAAVVGAEPSGGMRSKPGRKTATRACVTSPATPSIFRWTTAPVARRGFRPSSTTSRTSPQPRARSGGLWRRAG